jgi:hypothetical protein
MCARARVCGVRAAHTRPPRLSVGRHTAPRPVRMLYTRSHGANKCATTFSAVNAFAIQANSKKEMEDSEADWAECFDFCEPDGEVCNAPTPSVPEGPDWG